MHAGGVAQGVRAPEDRTGGWTSRLQCRGPSKGATSATSPPSGSPTMNLTSPELRLQIFQMSPAPVGPRLSGRLPRRTRRGHLLRRRKSFQEVCTY